MYATATDAAPVAMSSMQRDAAGVWTASLAAAPAPALYYGFRAWGTELAVHDLAWTPGSDTGRITDADSDGGNRIEPEQARVRSTRARAHARSDDARSARRLVLLDERREPHEGLGPRRAARDPVPRRSHRRKAAAPDARLRRRPRLRGAPPRLHERRHRRGRACAGTYAGAATRAAYLADLGVTAVEFLPLAETPNDRNDVDSMSDAGDNYWGYSTLAYFAPDRRYACDRSPGGPTRELRAMVKAFHDRGIKVLVDVVYNHTAEGGGGSLYSLRGLDNAGYYQLDAAGTGYTNSNGVGADLAPAAKPEAAALVVDSLRYWQGALGVDGFRFDLAPRARLTPAAPARSTSIPRSRPRSSPRSPRTRRSSPSR